MNTHVRTKTALAIRHLHFEDIGTLGPVLEQSGYQLRYFDVGHDEIEALDTLSPDLLIVLGGPVGVYETDIYPWLTVEIAQIARRLAQDLPTLGLCLGAQLIAIALGGQVRPMRYKEIGYGLIDLTAAGLVSPLRHLSGVEVLHWHGDAIELPPEAENLALTALCPVQAFQAGNALGLQFHPEVFGSEAWGIESWLIGHASELQQAGIDRTALRARHEMQKDRLSEAACRMFTEWICEVAE